MDKKSEIERLAGKINKGIDGVGKSASGCIRGVFIVMIVLIAVKYLNEMLVG